MCLSTDIIRVTICVVRCAVNVTHGEIVIMGEGPNVETYFNEINVPYVYWIVHHLDSWIKRDQLDVTCFFISLFNDQHVSDVNTSNLRSLRLICWVISWVVLLWFDVRWCYVVVSLGWCGIRMQAEALEYCFSLHPDTTPPQPNHNVTATRIEPEQYNPWNNLTNKFQAPENGCINIRNMLSIKYWNKKQVTSSWSLFNYEINVIWCCWLNLAHRAKFQVFCVHWNEPWPVWKADNFLTK